MHEVVRGLKRMNIILAVALLAIGAGVALVGAQVVSRNSPAEPPTDRQLSSLVNDSLGLRASQVVRMSVPDLPGEPLITDVSIDGTVHTLELVPHSVRGAEYRVLAQIADGSYVEVDPGPVRTMRGRLLDVEDSMVAASLEEDGLYARIFLPGDEQYWVQPIASRIAGATADQYAVYRNDDIISPEGACGLEFLPNPQAEPDSPAQPQTSRGGACGTGTCLAELACDADFEYFLDWGSVVGVENRINNVVNAINVQYERDVDIVHQITTIIVRTAEPDPYTSTDAVTLLNQFRNHWLNNHGNIQRDAAQLFTGKNLNGGTIGVAWLNGVCNSFGFSVVESDCCGSFGCATDLSAHELGHNWGANHCSCTGYTMNPFITCANVFHPTFSIPEMVSFRNSRTCLDGGGECQTHTDCDDLDACTTDVCSAGVCSNTPVSCDDRDACTTDSCDPATGCVNDPIDCDDADACTTDSCDPGSGCVNDPIVCDPGEVCINGVCEPAACDNNGVCAGLEDCDNCPNDCISGGGPGCGNGVCERSLGEDCLSCQQDCRGKQNGKQSRRFCCGDGDGENPVDCSDARCTSDGFACSDTPASSFCCGDDNCEGAEDSCNCQIDCGAPPADESSCTDGFDDDCDGATDCADTDCSGDPSCDCQPLGATCTEDPDCCSNKCKGRAGNKTCK
ncbi:MAG: M12 family metallo-peptidase [Planctomycetota bacterium]|jgi:hypothetical protein